MRQKFIYSKLRGRIREIYTNEKKFASALDLSAVTLSAKLNNQVEWKQSEILEAIQLLELQKSDIPEYFFNESKD